MKAGYKTTEAWISFAGCVLGFLMASGMFGEGNLIQAIGGICASIFGASYGLGRSLVKQGELKSNAAASVAEALAKKSQAD